jgi:glycosyltransferase involved in cell wall biosynthesis
MKILYLVDDLQANGGIQSLAKTTNRGLNDNYIVTMESWSSPLGFFKKVIVFLAPGKISANLYRRYLSENINKQLRRSRYDLIHFWHVKTAMAASNIMNVPYIITCHGSEIMESSIARYQVVLFLDVLHNASAITTPSGFTKQYLVEHYNIQADKIFIFPPGIDDRFYKIKNRPLKNRPLTIGTLTRLVPRKNIINIIKALNLLNLEGIDFEYILAGDGSTKYKKTILAELEKTAFKKKYLGRISEKQKINDFYKKIDIFVLPPLELKGDVEGFGIVYLEANAFGIPVVAARTGGVSDAVDSSTGVFSDPTSPEDIAINIKRLLASKDSYRSSCKIWANKFNESASAKRFGDLYSRILG